MKKRISCKAISLFLAVCLCFSVFSVGTFSVSAETELTNTTAMIAIDPSKVSEDTTKDFISKKAYPGGTTLTFDACINSDTTGGDFWWYVRYTTDPSTGDVYGGSISDIYGQWNAQGSSNADWGQWKTHTITIPEGDNYYFYLCIKPDGQSTSICYFDNFKVVDSKGRILLDEDFELGLEDSCFNYRTASVSIENYIPHTTYNNYVSLDLLARGGQDGADYLFISNQTYPAGSTVTFDAFIPASFTGWWGVGNSTTLNCDGYGAAGANSLPKESGKWATYTKTLPETGGPYYFYIFPSCDLPDGSECKLLVDNVLVHSADGETLAKETFDNGLGESIFYVNQGWASFIREPIAEDHVAAVDFDHSYQEIIMVTKEKYAGGSTVSFDAYLPAEPSWWAISYKSTAPTASDWYSWTSGAENGVQLSSSYREEWHKYSVTLPTTEESYYLYFVAEIRTDNSRTATTFLFDNFTVFNPSGTVVEKEDFESGLAESIFHFKYKTDLGIASTWIKTLGARTADHVAGIYPNQMNENGSGFMTKKAYPAGSKVSFDAFIPTGALSTWWGFCWTSDNTAGSVYDAFNSDKGYKFTGQLGEWAHYEFTVGGQGNQYLYLAAAIGEWSRTAGDNLEILIDNFLILDSNNYIVAQESFDNGVENSSFSADASAVETVDLSNYVIKENVSSINANALSTTASNPTFITKNAYPIGTKVSFDAYIPAGTTSSNGWWGFGFTTDPNSADIYDIWNEGKGTGSLGGSRSTWEHREFIVTAADESDTSARYLFLATAVGEFDPNDNSGNIMLDNFIITTSDGKIITENFNLGLETLFNYDSAVALIDVNGESEAIYTPGDLNNDGNINIIDLVKMKKCLAGVSNLGDYLGAADLDKDGDVSSTDLGLLRKTLLGVSYTVEHAVNFTAYAAPTVSGTAVEGENLELAYQKMSEAGFTKAIALYEGYSNVTGNDVYDTIEQRSSVTEAQAQIALQYAQKYGMKYYVKDWSLYDLGASNGDSTTIDSTQVNTEAQFKQIIENMFSAENPYVQNPAYAGNFGWDEPSVKDSNQITWMAKYYYQQMKALNSPGELFINLLPSYVGEQGTGTYTGILWWKNEITKDYASYIDDYIANVAKPYTGYVCWDYYPFMESYASGKTSREQGYLNNFALIANKCKNNNIELRTFVQATSDSTNIRTINSKKDLGFQIYNGLAFGVKDFIYYQYSGRNSTTGCNLYNQNTQRYTDVYDYASEINHEILRFADVLGEYSWESTMIETVDNGNFISGFDAAYTVDSYNGASIVSATHDTLVGCFKATNGLGNAFMVVNELDVAYSSVDTVVLNVGSATSAIVYVDGIAAVLPVVDGQVTLDVASGSGVFVIPQ